MRKKRKSGVIPGFGLSMGVTVFMLALFVLLPVVSLVAFTGNISPEVFWREVSSPRVRSALLVTIGTSFAAAFFNTWMGLLLAWVLVRYEFPGKKLIDGMIELPFALPTAVAGIALTSLTAKSGMIGRLFAKAGISIAYTKTGIVAALIFIGIPFVVRSVGPVLSRLPKECEEAADMLGASGFTLFRKIIFPELLPALLSGAALTFGRGLGEYGSVVFIAGNKPFDTEVISLVIMTKLQEFDYTGAVSVALVMLILAFLVLLLGNYIRAASQRKFGGNG